MLRLVLFCWLCFQQLPPASSEEVVNLTSLLPDTSAAEGINGTEIEESTPVEASGIEAVPNTEVPKVQSSPTKSTSPALGTDSKSPTTLPANMTAINVQLGKLTIYPVPPVVDHLDGLELFCSVGYHDSASIVWTLNDLPLDDIVARSHISGRKDFLVKSLRIQVDHLQTLPAPDYKYVFECVASVDGNLLKEKVEIASSYKDLCKNDSECEFKNAVCREGYCACDDLHPVRLNSTHLTCRPMARLGWPCSYGEQCVAGDPHSECGSKGECSCVEGYKAEVVFNMTSACVSKKGVNTPCKTDADCSEIGAVCSHWTCQCPSGSMETRGRCVLLQSGGPSSTDHTETTASVAVKKILPVRILKVREFPRHSVDGNGTNFNNSLDGLVRLDVNDTHVYLAKQRVLTSGSWTVGNTGVVMAFCLAFWSCQQLF